MATEARPSSDEFTALPPPPVESLTEITVPPPATPEWMTSGPSDFSAVRSTKSAPHQRRGIRLLAATVAVLLVAGAAVGVIAVTGRTTKADAALVSSAAAATLADKTAHVNMSGTFTVGSHTITLTGGGDIDFTGDQSSMEFAYGDAGLRSSLIEVVTGGTIYLNEPTLSSADPGKSWLSLNYGSLTEANALNPTMSSNADTDPAAMLQVLRQEGATVTSLGSSTIDGTTVNGYSVKFDKAAIANRLSSSNLPSWAKQATSSVDFGGLSMQVFVNGTGELRRMTVDFGGSSSGISGNITMDLTQLGAPVSVSPPPLGQVISLNQFLQQDFGGLAAAARS